MNMFCDCEHCLGHTEGISAKPIQQSIPEPGELLADPCTPFWAQRLIKELMEKDPVDAANTLAVLAQSFGARAHKMLGGR